MSDTEFKCLLITGGCGFIGSNFINQYHERHPNTKIINIDVMYYCALENNVNENVRKSGNYKLIKINLTDLRALIYILEQEQIDGVIHFAAQSHVQNSFEQSIQYTIDNILGTHCLLEACRTYGLNPLNTQIKKFIHVSTDEVYGESDIELNEKKTEASVLCPTNPYAATKAGAELIARSYCSSFKMPIIITRGNNVYGPRQYPEKLIPRFIKLLLEDQKVTIQGDGSHLRAFLYVDDVVNAFELILHKGEIGHIYNIGCSSSDEEYSVSDVAVMLIQRIKGTVEPVENFISYIQDRPFNDKRYYICNDRLKNLGWVIKEDFENGLSKTIEWYRENMNQYQTYV